MAVATLLVLPDAKFETTLFAKLARGLLAPAVVKLGLADATAVVSRLLTKPADCAKVKDEAAAAAAGLFAVAVADASTAWEAEETAVTLEATEGAMKLATEAGDKVATAGAAEAITWLVAARVTVPDATAVDRFESVFVDVIGVAVTAASTACTAFWKTALLTVVLTVVEALLPVTAPVTAVVVFANMVCTAAVVWISAGLEWVTGSVVIKLVPVRFKLFAVVVAALVTCAAVGAEGVPATGVGNEASTEACTRLVKGDNTDEPGGAFISPTKAVPEEISTPPDEQTMWSPPFGLTDAAKL